MFTQSTALLRRPLAALTGFALLAIVAPVFAQTANSEPITLSAYPPATARVSGHIVGTFSLSNIAASDQDGNLCAGFADASPDHILTLESDFPSLTISVDSGQDTTLLIQGPTDNTIHCGQDISRSNLDAQVTDDNWQAGTYRIWVGAHEQGRRLSYSLLVEE